MRKLSNNLKYLLSLDSIALAYLIKIETPTTTISETTAAFDITLPGLGVFYSNSSLSTVDDIRLSKAVDRAIYKIVYIDPDFQKRALFEVGLTGSKVTVYLCFFNDTNAPINGVQPGDIFSDPDDIVIVYSGTIDTQGYTINASEGTVIASIDCASPMASLDLNKEFLTSKDSMQRLNPNDTAFDQVISNSARATLLWGKA